MLLLGVFGFKKWRGNNRYRFKGEKSKAESPIEEMMIELLRKEGYKPYTQVPCKGYRIDIALYEGGRKFAIECDGKAFHTSPKQKLHDEKKNRILRENQWDIIRFKGTHIYSSPEYCMKVVRTRTKS